jgi:protein-disulfide isomerase
VTETPLEHTGPPPSEHDLAEPLRTTRPQIHPVAMSAVDTPDVFQVNGSSLRMAVIALVFLVIGFAAGAALLGGRGTDTAEIEAMVRQIVAEEIANAGGLGGAPTGASLVDDDPSFGPDDAAVTIVEFSDFNCTYCTRFATETLPQLQARYGDHIRFVYRDYPILGGSEPAIASNCAHDQGKFWEYHNLLFSNQQARSRDMYISFADELGLDADSFAMCLDDQAKVEEMTLDYIDGQTLGIQGTPKFYVNSKVISGAQPFETFTLVIDSELEKAGVTPPVVEGEPEA